MKNHIFPGANTAVYEVLGLKQNAALVERWAQSGFLLQHLADLYREPEASPPPEGDERLRGFLYLDMVSDLAAPPRPGDVTELEIHTRNIHAGHAFPSSALDLFECWLELRVTDERGREVYASGGLDEHQRLLPDTHTMMGYMVGQDDRRVDRNRIWQIKRKVVGRQIPPGGETVDRFSFTVPEDSAHLNVEAQWRYRLYNAEYWEWAYGAGVPVPAITVVRRLWQYPATAPRGN